MTTTAVLVSLLLLLTACSAVQPSAAPSPARTATVSASATATVTPVVATATQTPTATPAVRVLGLATAPPAAQSAVLAAAADLAERLGLPAGTEVTVASVTPRDWPDASLGCPEEGRVYAQVITPGYVVVLQAQGAQYRYHTDAEDTAVLCQRRSPVDSVTPMPKQGRDRTPWQPSGNEPGVIVTPRP